MAFFLWNKNLVPYKRFYRTSKYKRTTLFSKLKNKLNYRFDGFLLDRRTCGSMIEGKRKISWFVHKLQSENLLITDREVT